MTMPRIGMDLPDRRSGPLAVDAILRAETRGVPMMWSIVGGVWPDAITFFAAALARTTNICLGTAIVPTYPRHPVTLYNQVTTLSQLAPGRFRLGIGPSHRAVISDALGIPMVKPLDHLREYLTVLRSLLETGEANFDGDFFNVHIGGGTPAPMPIYVSALRKNAFRLAGEAADGAISWLCPVQYLLDVAIPSMQAGAADAGRAVPRMIAHVPVVLSTDLGTVREVAGPVVSRYAQREFYANMFRDAGYPVGENNQVTDALLDHLVVNGDRKSVQQRLEAILETGIDELLVMLIPADDAVAEEEVLSEIVVALDR